MAAKTLITLKTHWLDLLIGVEGFLTSPESRAVSGRPVEWGEMDSMGHVNNVMYNKYAETGRINWVQLQAKTDLQNEKHWNALWSPKGRKGLILKSLNTAFKFPLTYPDKITVLHKLLPLDHSNLDSYSLEAVVVSERHRRVAARFWETTVVYDYREGRKVQMDDWMLRRLESVLVEQDGWRKRCQSKIRTLDGEVHALEKSCSG